MEAEFKDLANELSELQAQYVSEFDHLSHRWEELVDRHKRQVHRWSRARPHESDQEISFLEQRDVNMSIVDQHHEWLVRFNASHGELKDELEVGISSDALAKFNSFLKARDVISRSLREELPILRAIVDSFDVSVADLASFKKND